MAVRGRGDAWAMARCRGNQSLYVVLEQRGAEGLLQASILLDQFANHHFARLFQ